MMGAGYLEQQVFLSLKLKNPNRVEVVSVTTWLELTRYYDNAPR